MDETAATAEMRVRFLSTEIDPDKDSVLVCAMDIMHFVPSSSKWTECSSCHILIFRCTCSAQQQTQRDMYLLVELGYFTIKHRCILKTKTTYRQVIRSELC